MSQAVVQSLDVAGVALLTINRPDALNALNGEVLDGVAAAVEELQGKAKAIIITGTGKAFVAGADIEEMADMDQEQATAFSKRGQAAFQALCDFEGLTVAAVNGYALGGGLELALACDLVIASERATVGFPEVKLAVVPGFGGTQRLPRRVGVARAKWMLMTGENIDATTAHKWGVVDKVVPGEQLMAETRKVVDTVLHNGPLAVTAVQQLVDAGFERPLDAALDLEATRFGSLFATEDQKEGMKAFLEKRKPTYKGA